VSVYHYFTLWRHNNGFRNRDPVTPDLPLNIKLNFVTLDCDSVVAHVNFGMLLVGRTLVKTNKDIPLRLMNVSSQPKTLYEGTVIAKISPVSVFLYKDYP
jgi:hypothetical protein